MRSEALIARPCRMADDVAEARPVVIAEHGECAPSITARPVAGQIGATVHSMRRTSRLLRSVAETCGRHLRSRSCGRRLHSRVYGDSQEAGAEQRSHVLEL